MANDEVGGALKWKGEKLVFSWLLKELLNPPQSPFKGGIGPLHLISLDLYFGLVGLILTPAKAGGRG